MKIVVVKEGYGVDVYNKWSQVKNDYPTLIPSSDFVKEGDDHICIVDKETYQVTKDIKLLESIATEKVFGKKEIDWMTVIANAIIVAAVLVMFGG